MTEPEAVVPQVPKKHWRVRWDELAAEYAAFETQQRTLGVLWCDIPNVTEWALDRHDAAEAKVRELEATIAQQAATIDRLQRIANFYEWQSGICSICRGVKSTGHGMSCDYARKP